MSKHLTAGQRALLEAELQQRRRALEAQLAEHLHGQSRAERAHEVAQQDADDAPQRVPERELAMTLTDKERAELQAVVDAQRRMAGDAYGMCSDCESEIPFDRLKVEPWALRCVDCESRRERQRG